MDNEIDTTNYACVSAKGDQIVMLNPPRGVLERDEALTIAAWIVAIADPGGERFKQILEAVCAT